MENVNERLLRIVGTVVLPESIPLDEEVTLGLTANITKREQRSNSDGTSDLIHTAKLTGEVLISNKWGKNIQAKSKGSPSQRLRSRMRQLYEGDDFEKAYEGYINRLIIDWEDIKEKYERN